MAKPSDLQVLLGALKAAQDIQLLIRAGKSRAWKVDEAIGILFGAAPIVESLKLDSSLIVDMFRSGVRSRQAALKASKDIEILVSRAILITRSIEPAELPAAKKRGSPRRYPEPDDRILYDHWQAAKRQGTPKDEFARKVRKTPQEITALVDRIRRRRHRDA